MLALITLALAASGMMSVQAATSLTTCQKQLIFEATNTYENSQIDPLYSYCENLDDGRGFTCGIVGFTTGTHDAYQVILQYNKASGSTGEFKDYLTALRTLDSKEQTGSVKGLKGFCKVWEGAATNPVFRQVQEDARDTMYFKPSQGFADNLGLDLPLTRGQLYDAAIQHGIGEDYDSLDAMVARATAAAGGSPSSVPPVDELTWLDKFLTVREDTLCHPENKETQKEWCESVTRVKSYRHALDSGKTGMFEETLEILDNDGKSLTLTCSADSSSTFSVQDTSSEDN